MHTVRMEERVEDDLEFSPHRFQETFNILEKKRGDKYKSILLAGPALKSALYKLFEVSMEQRNKTRFVERFHTHPTSQESEGQSKSSKQKTYTYS